MRVYIEKRLVYTIDVDEDTYVQEFPVEYNEWLGMNEPGYNGDGNTREARREFVEESIAEYTDETIDSARLGDFGLTLVDMDVEWETDFRR